MPNELVNIKEKWVYFLKNAGDLDCISSKMSDPCITEAFDAINEAGLSQEELELQEKRYDFIRLQKGALELAAEQGMERGIERGIESVAVNMLAAGVPKAEVMKFTGLTLAQLDALS